MSRRADPAIQPSWSVLMPKQKLDLHPYAPKNNLSIPNLISLVRLALIPCFIWTYLQGQPGWTVGLVIFSGLTDRIVSSAPV